MTEEEQRRAEDNGIEAAAEMAQRIETTAIKLSEIMNEEKRVQLTGELADVARGLAANLKAMIGASAQERARLLGEVSHALTLCGSTVDDLEEATAN